MVLWALCKNTAVEILYIGAMVEKLSCNHCSCQLYPCRIDGSGQVGKDLSRQDMRISNNLNVIFAKK